MPLDSFTLLLASCIAVAFIGLALLHFWSGDRASRWLLWWAVPFILGGVGAMGYLRPNWETDPLTIGLGNGVRIFAFCLFWQGARVFHGRPPQRWAMALIPLAWLGLCLVPSFLASLHTRVMAVSLFNGLLCVLAAWELWRGRAEKLASRRAAVMTFLSFAALMLLRLAAVDVLPFPMGALPPDVNWMGLFNLAVFVHATFLGFLLIALTKERHEAEQRQFALLDPLTGLMNRRAFMGEAERSARRVNIDGGPMALLVLDLDNFKSINDSFGHEVGDRVLVAFAAVAEACVRPTDQLHRMGGEEFCFILPNTSLKEAVAIAERIRRAFAQASVDAYGGRAGATVSIGIAGAEHAGVDLEVLHAAADAAVYEAKARGRDCVVVADPETLRRFVEDSVQQRRIA